MDEFVIVEVPQDNGRPNRYQYRVGEVPEHLQAFVVADEHKDVAVKNKARSTSSAASKKG